MDRALELEDLINMINKPTKKKVVKKFSKVTRDESRSRMLHLAVPRVDKDRNEITPNEYNITIVNLGNTSKAQVIEYFDESYLALNE